MKSRRTPLVAEVYQYETGKHMEDVVTKGWVTTDCLVKIKREDGSVVCPYILNRRGCTFIGVGDYIVQDEDGTRHVCSEQKIWTRYEKPAELS